MDNLIDEKLLAAAKATMQDRFQMMVDYYIEDTNNYLENIRRGVAGDDAAAVMMAAHTIKSSSRMLGLVVMSDLAKDIEMKARVMDESGQSDMTVIEPLFIQLEQCHQESLEALAKL